MSQRGAKRANALRILVAAACIVVVVAGLKFSGDILLPILFSVFLSIVALPLVRGLQRLRVPNWVAIPIVVILFAGALVGVTSIIAGTLRQFTTEVVHYEDGFNQLVDQGIALASRAGFAEVKDSLEHGEFAALLTPNAIMNVVRQTLNAVVGLFGRVVIVIVTMTFILFEASEIEEKFRAAFGTRFQPAGPFTGAGQKVTRYLLIKTVVSAITGIAAGLCCRFLGVDFWLLWGMIAFLLNYIPSIGSFLAAIPPMLLALVQFGPATMLVVGLCYIAINLLLGNFIEPRLMGQSLGLSPLVVFLSLVFWGWLWGPAGMLVCVPLTVMAKLVLASNEDTRWIAIFLGPTRDAREETVGTGESAAGVVISEGIAETS